MLPQTAPNTSGFLFHHSRKRCTGPRILQGVVCLQIVGGCAYIPSPGAQHPDPFRDFLPDLLRRAADHGFLQIDAPMKSDPVPKLSLDPGHVHTRGTRPHWVVVRQCPFPPPGRQSAERLPPQERYKIFNP